MLGLLNDLHDYLFQGWANLIIPDIIASDKGIHIRSKDFGHTNTRQAKSSAKPRIRLKH